MRCHNRTLFITSDGIHLSKKGETLLLTRRGEPAVRLPIHLIDDVVCMGRVTVTPWAMNLCAFRGIPITLLSSGGRMLARVVGPQRGNVQVRRQQFRTAQSPEDSVILAREFIFGKVANARSLLLRFDRQRKESGDTDVFAAARRMGRLMRQVRQNGGMSMERLRALEGEAARRYYHVFHRLITTSNPYFSFERRTRRPPKDPVNALLSYAYTFLVLDVQAACEAVGLDPQVGFLHADRSGRPSLALDLMEELRPILADRLVLSLINRRQLGPEHFVTRSDGGVLLNRAGQTVFCQARHHRRGETVRHPVLQETVSYGCIPLIQAKLLAKTFRGELSGYPALILK